MGCRSSSPWELFEESTGRFPDNSLVIHNGIELTYSEMYNEVLGFSAMLGEYQFRLGGIYLPNCIEFITCILALNRLGKIAVPMSHQLKGYSLSERLNCSDVEIVITDSAGYSELINVEDNIKIKRAYVLQRDGKVETVDFGHWSKVQHEFKEGTFGICFTSGSTSEPKGVVISNRSITGNALAVAEFLKFGSRDRIIITRPFAQASPISGDILMAVSCGASIVVYNDLFYPAIFLKAVEDLGVTTAALVKTTLSQILDYPRLTSFDLSTLSRVIYGGMQTPRSLIRRAREKLPGVRLYNAYGLTEASTRVAFLEPELAESFPESIGRPIKGCSLEILRHDGSKADAGEIGEIFVRSSYLMDGYYRQEELTARVLAGNGLHTRDIGFVDENGLYYVLGRNDDLIIQGGNNIMPAEIEEVLARHPFVGEAAVFGADDEKLGKRIIACVRLSRPGGATVQDLNRWCRKNLEDRKVPRELYIVDSLPRNEAGKIVKSELYELYARLRENGRLRYGS